MAADRARSRSRCGRPRSRARGMAMPPLVANCTRPSEELDYERRRRMLPEPLRRRVPGDDDEVVVPSREPRSASRSRNGLRGRTAQIAFRRGTGRATVPDSCTSGSSWSARAGRAVARHRPASGNFLMVGDRLGCWTSVRSTPGGLPETFGRLIAGDARRGHRSCGTQTSRGRSFIKPGKHLEVTSWPTIRAFTEPARHETFAYSREWLRGPSARSTIRATRTSRWPCR